MAGTSGSDTKLFQPSASPTVVNHENDALHHRVGTFYRGFVLSKKFNAGERPFLAIGGRSSGGIEVRRFGEIDRPAGSLVADDKPVDEECLEWAGRLAEGLRPFSGVWNEDRWRLIRCIDIYEKARCNLDTLDRIHQFTRCIEGLVAPLKVGQIDVGGKKNNQGTKVQFKRRTELFVGPRHHDLMGELYDIRSDIEHLHEDRHLANFDRATRVRLVELEAISEWIARHCLARILLEPALARHVGSVAALDRFWAKPETERREIWGPPVDPQTPLVGFNFDRVTDEELGLPPPG